MKAHKVDLKTKTISLPHPQTGEAVDVNFDYKTQIKTVLEFGGRGIDLKTVLRSAKVVRELEAADGKWLVSEDDYRFLIERMENFSWGNASNMVAEFIEDIQAAPVVDVAEPGKRVRK